MSRYNDHQFDADTVPVPPGQLSANGHWIFGSIYAALALVGFGFGVWAGAPPKQKAPEVAEAKKEPEKPAPNPPAPKPQPAPAPVVPVIEPKKSEPAPKPEPKVKEPEPKKTEPEPKKPEPKPVVKEPEPKKPERVVTFKDVQPIFRAYCNDCHGASTGKPKGGVDLTSVAKMLKSQGPPLVAGKPTDSTVYTSVKGGDMPPDGKKGPDEKELQLLYDWIAGGAKERRRTIRVRRVKPLAGRRKVELTPGAEPE